MQITFLGTSAGVPTRSRNVSCVALRPAQRGEIWLFDCGEGTQHQILRSDVKISQIRRIFITHLHGDHLFGLTGLLASAGMSGHAEQIDIYGPQGLAEYVRDVNQLSETRLSYSVRLHTVAAGLIFEDDEYRVTCGLLEHRTRAFGYRVEEKERPGVFDVGKAIAMGIPSGPIYGRLKRGERVTLEDGRVIDGREFVGPPLSGRSFVYCTDTIYCRGAVELARNADLLIHEATFSHTDEDLARRSLHSTTEMAARVATEAGVRQLIITHLSPRYLGIDNSLGLDELLAEARAVFPNTEMARDFLSVEIERRKAIGNEGA